MPIPATMTALRLHGLGRKLEADTVPVPRPAAHEVLLEVLACGVCRTDVHVLDGELPGLRYPLIPGHEIVGRVVAAGDAVAGVRVGERVGVPWLAHTCGVCELCRAGLENLCPRATFTGYTAPGGYAELVAADASFCLPIPPRYSDVDAAPLLCAGLIGYRAYRAAGEAARLGLYGFGAAAHLLAQLAVAQHRRVYAFTRPGDGAGQAFARRLGATWAGGSDEPPAEPYRLLWGERSIASVANLTRADGREFMRLAATLQLQPHVEAMPLDAANDALARLKAGRIEGAAVLVPRR